MSKPSTISEWVRGAEARLRWAQASCDDLSVEQRKEHLASELDQELLSLPQKDRKEAMRELILRFPEPERPVKSSSLVADEASSLGMAFMAGPPSALECAKIIADAWLGLPKDQRDAVEKLLESVGIATHAHSSSIGSLESMLSVPPSKDQQASVKLSVLRLRLEMDDADQARPLDLYNLLSLVEDLFSATQRMSDRLAAAWGGWQEMAPQFAQAPQSTTDFATLVRNYLVEGQGMTGKALRDLEVALEDQARAVQLLISVMAGIGLGGRAFATGLANRMAPEEIIRTLRVNRGRPTAEECWNAYEDLANRHSPSEIEDELREQITSAADRLFRQSK